LSVRRSLFIILVGAGAVLAPSTARADDRCGQWVSRESLYDQGVALLTPVEGSTNPVLYDLYRPWGTWKGSGYSSVTPEVFAYAGGPGLHLRAMEPGEGVSDFAPAVFVDDGPGGGSQVCGYTVQAVDASTMVGTNRWQGGAVVVDTTAVSAPPSPFHNPFTLEAVVGLPLGRTHTTYTPVGRAGVALDYDPWEFLQLSAGLGQAMGGGAQVGLMGRLRLVLTDNWGIGAGIGASMIRGSSSGPGTAGGDNQYGEGELFTEYRWGGFVIRLSLGQARSRNVATVPTVSTSAAPSLASSLPYTYLAAGWSF
jgi:hypothetical protein